MILKICEHVRTLPVLLQIEKGSGQVQIVNYFRWLLIENFVKLHLNALAGR